MAEVLERSASKNPFRTIPQNIINLTAAGIDGFILIIPAGCRD
jgi:hypothetical protein